MSTRQFIGLIFRITAAFSSIHDYHSLHANTNKDRGGRYSGKSRVLVNAEEKSPPQSRFVYTVGGKIENGESPHAAAIREVQEEAGLQIEDAHYCGLLVDSSPTDYNWICFVYRASVDYFAPPDCNEGTLAWVPIESLATLPTPVTDPYLYPRVLSGQPFFLNALYSKENDLIELTEEISDTRLFPE